MSVNGDYSDKPIKAPKQVYQYMIFLSAFAHILWVCKT